MSNCKKIILSEKHIPTHWYNIAADMPNPPTPPLHPGTKQPVKPEDLAPIFPESLIKQELCTDRWVEIPEEVREIYKMWRPAPLVRATQLEKALDTPARIYFKNESVSPSGSHKSNTSIPQAYYNAKDGVKRLTTETGAGQWGSALSLACNYFGLECVVYMVKVSYNQKPYRRLLMETWGAKVFASPSNNTEAGRKILAEHPDTNGSLGMAISEAVEDAVNNENTKYSLGSVLNHVLLHQTIIGQEAKAQLEIAGDYPDVIVGCVGGGSNFAGLAFPFLYDKLTGKANPRLLAVEPCACPTLTRGRYAYDFGDTAGFTPLLPMYTLGKDFVPPGIHAGGLRYHGAASLLSQLVKEGYIDCTAVKQKSIFNSAILFARTEGILPAPESAHAIHAAVEEALRAKEAGEERVILFGLSGHGHFDLSAYEMYLSGKVEDVEYSKEALDQSLAGLPQV
jgi:tryptophan synthase beta chain